MTTNNDESRPRRSYHSANNERHASSNRNYGNERRTQQDGYYSERSSYNQERSYNPERSSYNPNYRDSRQENYSGNSEGGIRKRRPRVGERPQSPQRVTGGNYNNRSWGNQPSPGGPGRPNKPAKPVKKLKKKKPFKQVKYKENADPNAPIRLNKYLANAGVCSRREADEFIQAGVVKVNGQVVTELGTKITRADAVMFHNQPVQLESKVYVLLNKPKGFVTTTDDPENRKTVMELVKSAASERIYPVGRLDRATTGVLLLTNDGDLASKLTHPKYEKRKIYQVWLDKPVEMEHMQMIADGIELEDGEIHADAISYVTEEDLTQVGIEIHSGRNRIIRRIFEKLGYRVLKLDRVYFAGLTKKKLSRGKWRYLTEQEVNMLRMGAFD
ncbi:pseudouridine synthase [uncultured Proteiniphilum sp.]|uniref:pseudouridine synthase n=1 Tax=uncultured Proteiniphilum sp. TaxID=497637 RepID=UPI002633BCAF|nr:pseudouridine synthase [uncultured Proteiniphilum sp.]